MKKQLWFLGLIILILSMALNLVFDLSEVVYMIGISIAIALMLIDLIFMRKHRK